jgi:hypothetical protein
MITNAHRPQAIEEALQLLKQAALPIVDYSKLPLPTIDREKSLARYEV